MNITKLVLRRPVSTALVVLGIIVFGVFSIPGFSMELIPDIELPMYLVNTVYPGADPTTIDELVTSKIEDAAETLSGVDSVASYSYNDYCMVLLTYDYGQNMNDAYTSLSAALDMLDLPDDAQEPVIIEMDVNQVPTVSISATSSGSSDMMAYIDQTVVPALEGVGNVARVEVTGGRTNYVRVRLNEDSMRQYGLNISSIAQQVGAADYNVPAGKIKAGSQEISINTSADFLSLQTLENTTLTTATGAQIRLKDVAKISMGVKNPSSISRYNGAENVTIQVYKVQSASTVRVASNVRKALESRRVRRALDNPQVRNGDVDRLRLAPVVDRDHDLTALEVHRRGVCACGAARLDQFAQLLPALDALEVTAHVDVNHAFTPFLKLVSFAPYTHPPQGRLHAPAFFNEK